MFWSMVSPIFAICLVLVFTDLREAGAKDVTYMRFDSAGHGVFGQHREETYLAMEQFFARTLCIGGEEEDQ